jgi:hypothetical protein
MCSTTKLHFGFLHELWCNNCSLNFRCFCFVFLKLDHGPHFKGRRAACGSHFAYRSCMPSLNLDAILQVWIPGYADYNACSYKLPSTFPGKPSCWQMKRSGGFRYQWLMTIGIWDACLSVCLLNDVFCKVAVRLATYLCERSQSVAEMAVGECR